MNDVEDRVRAALAARASVTQPSYDAADELTERIGRARRARRLQIVAAAAVLVVLAVALPLAITRAGDGHTGAPPAGPVSLPPAPAPSGSVPTPRSTPPTSSASSTPPAIPDHAYFAGMLTSDEAGVFDASTGHPAGSMTVPGAEAVATWPGHGWLTTRRSADGCHSNFTSIMAGTRIPDTRSASTMLVAPEPGLLDEIVVSPDGQSLAAVERSCASGSVDLLVIDLATGAQHRWLRPGPEMNAVNGLTWSADSKRLAYTSGVNTGGGLGGGYTQLDATAAGGTLSAVLPGTGQVEIGSSRCDVDRGLWLGTSGRFAVFAYCPGSDDLFLAQVPFGSAVPRGQVVASLPGERATLFPDTSVTADGRHLLLTTDSATYRIDDGKVFRLDGAWRSPSW